jgi:hypothetical protein
MEVVALDLEARQLRLRSELVFGLVTPLAITMAARSWIKSYVSARQTRQSRTARPIQARITGMEHLARPKLAAPAASPLQEELLNGPS